VKSFFTRMIQVHSVFLLNDFVITVRVLLLKLT